MSSVRTDIERGAWGNPRSGRKTVEEVGEAWLSSNPNKAFSTVARDRSVLKTHVYPKLGHLHIGQLSRVQIQTVVNGWTGAETSIHRQFRSLSALCSFAVKNGWIAKTPCVDIKLPECVPAERYLLSPEDTLKIAGAINGDNSTAIWVLAETGCRWGEAFGLRIKDVDLVEMSVSIERGLTRDSKGAPVLENGVVEKPDLGGWRSPPGSTTSCGNISYC